MSYLERFSQQQSDLLTALPYRVGLWISLSDSAGGDESHEAELKTLEALLIGFSEDCCKAEFVEEVIKASIVRKNEWGAWDKNISDLPQECQEVLMFLPEYSTKEDIHAFKNSLMDIALFVAAAYCESENTDAMSSRLVFNLQYYMQLLSASLGRHLPLTRGQMANVSSMEQSALVQLSGILKIEL